MTANPLCRIPKTPQIAGFSRFWLWTSVPRALALFGEKFAKLSLSPTLWTYRLSKPTGWFSEFLQVKELRVVSGEWFWASMRPSASVPLAAAFGCAETD
jgi:hypothetical protein